MVSLTKLQKNFPKHYLVNRYIQQLESSWTNGRYFLGGQIPLFPDETILEETIAIVEAKNNDTSSIVNSWEYASVERARHDIEEFKILFNLYKKRQRLNGLFRAIVFWISPARKRATEKVFHPSNLKVITDVKTGEYTMTFI